MPRRLHDHGDQEPVGDSEEFLLGLTDSQVPGDTLMSLCALKNVLTGLYLAVRNRGGISLK